MSGVGISITRLHQSEIMTGVAFKADHIMVIMTAGAIPNMFPVRIFVVWMRGMIHQLDPVT